MSCSVCSVVKWLAACVFRNHGDAARNPQPVGCGEPRQPEETRHDRLQWRSVVAMATADRRTVGCKRRSVLMINYLLISNGCIANGAP